MKQTILNAILISMAVLFLLSSCSFQSNKEENTKSDTVMSSVSDAAATKSDYVEEFTDFTITEIKHRDTPKKVSTAGFITPESVNDMFAMSSVVVRGKVTKVREYKISAKSNTGGESDVLYKSVIYLKVTRSYSDKELKYTDDNIITFIYPQSSTDQIEGLEYINKGDTIIAVLTDVEKAYDKINNINTIADYCTIMPSTTIYFKTEDGYAARELMVRAGQKGKKAYKLSEVEKVIEENICYLEGLTFKEYIEKYR